MSDYPIKIVKGNYFAIAQPLEKITWESGTEQVVDYIPEERDRITVSLVGTYRPYVMTNVTIDGNVLHYDNNGMVGVGIYGIEIKILCADGRWLRSYQQNKIQIVNSNEEAGIPDGDEFDVKTYEISGAVLLVVGGGSHITLYDETGYNTDGAMTQKAVTELFEGMFVPVSPDEVAEMADPAL